MPMNAKQNKKRLQKKRTYRRKQSSAIRKYPGFPREQHAVLKYVDQFTVPQAAPSFVYQLRANSIYDPDLTATGHQPLGHDQWEKFYNHYVVKGAKIMMEVTAAANSAAIPTMMGVYLSDDATLLNAPDLLKLCEQGKCNYRLHNGFANISTTKIMNSYSAKKFFNIKDLKDNVDRLGAPFGYNPTEEAIFNMIFNTANDSLNLPEFNVIFTVWYYVTFSEPKELPQS